MAKPIGYCQNNKQVVHPTMDQTSQRFKKIRGYNQPPTVITHVYLITKRDPHVF